MTSYADEPEGDERLGEMLGVFKDMIEVYASESLARIEDLEAETERLEAALEREKYWRQADAGKLKIIGALAYEVDARRLGDADAMAKIRGMFHGR